MVSVAEFNRMISEERVLFANQEPYPNAAIVAVTNIRVIGDEGTDVPVLTIDGVPRTDLTLDPVNVSLGIDDHYKKTFQHLTSPFIMPTVFKSVSIDNLPNDTMLAITGYNIRNEHPHAKHPHWQFC